MTERIQTIGNAKIQKKHLSVEKKYERLPKSILGEYSMRKVFFSNSIILCNFAF